MHSVVVSGQQGGKEPARRGRQVRWGKSDVSQKQSAARCAIIEKLVDDNRKRDKLWVTQSDLLGEADENYEFPPAAEMDAT